MEHAAIDETSTDVAGRLTFSNTWANADTLTLTFSKPYVTAPKVILGHNSAVNGSITSSAADKFVVTTTGTAAGIVDYLVIETK